MMGSEHSSQFATAVAHINQLSYYEASYYLVLTSSQLVVKDVTVTCANPSHHKRIPKYCFLYHRPTVYCSLLPSMKPKLFSFFLFSFRTHKKTASSCWSLSFRVLTAVIVKMMVFFCFVHRVVHLLCSSVSEKLNACVFRVTKLG